MTDEELQRLDFLLRLFKAELMDICMYDEYREAIIDNVTNVLHCIRELEEERERVAEQGFAE